MSDEAQGVWEMPQKKQKEPRKRGRRLLWWLGGFALALVLLVVLAPTIAGAFAPGIVEGQSGKSVAGAMGVQSASLSWFGPQRLTGVRLAGVDGKSIATADAEVGAGLVGLATGGLDLGDVKVSAVRATIVRDKDGRTNIERALATPGAGAKGGSVPASGGAGSGAGRLPAGLRLKLTLAADKITYEDAGLPGTGVRIENLDAAATVEPGTPLVLNLSGAIGEGTGPAGALKAKIKADRWSDADGTLTPSKAKISANVSGEGVPVGLLDAVAPGVLGQAGDGSPVTFRRALGDKLALTLLAEGTTSEGTATLDLRTPGATASAGVSLTGGTLTLKTPLNATVRGESLRWLVPGLDKSLAASASSTSVSTLPDATVTLDSLTLTLPKGGPLDLRGSGVRGSVALAETLGEVRLQEGGQKQPFRIAPLTVAVDAQDLAGPVHVKGSTSASISGQPAGDLSLDATLAGLLDKAGAPAASLSRDIRGTLAVRGFATPIVQPFLGGTGIDLPSDVGPTLDLALSAAPGDKGLTLSATCDAAQVRFAGSAGLHDDAIVAGKDGITVSLARAGKVIERLVKPSTGWAVSPWGGAADAGNLSLQVRSFELPMEKGSPRLDRLSLDAGFRVGKLVATPIGADARALPGAQLLNIILVSGDASMTPGAGAKAKLDASLGYAGKAFSLNADVGTGPVLTVEGGTLHAVTDPLVLRPVGTLRVTDLPSEIGGLIGALSGSSKPDLGNLLATLTGGALAVNVQAAPGSGAQATNLSLLASSTLMKAEVGAELTPKAFTVRKLAGEQGLTPAGYASLMKQFAPEQKDLPTLAAPIRASWSLDPFVVPLDAMKPQLDKTTPVTARLSIPGRTLVSGLTLGTEGGKPKPLDNVGVQNLNITALVPVAGLVGSAGDTGARLNADATLIGPEGDTIGKLSANASTKLDKGSPTGTLKGTVSVKEVPTPALDRLLGKPGLLAGFVGTPASVDVGVEMTPGKKASGPDFGAGTIDAELRVASPRLHSDAPIRVSVTPSHVALAGASSITLDVDPQELNTYLSGPGGNGVRLTEPASVRIGLEKFGMPRAGAQGQPLEVALRIGAPTVRLAGPDATPVSVNGLELNVRSQSVKSGPPPVDFSLAVPEATVGTAPPAKNLALTGTVSDLIGADGGVDPAHATLSARGNMPAIPTALVDVLANQKGRLVEGLGPVIELNVLVDRLALGGGQGGSPAKIDITMRSQRATLTVAGDVSGGVYTAQKPVELSILEMTPKFARDYIGIVPLIGSMEKSAKDAPASVVASNVTTSLSGDMSKLNADVVVNPGEMKFTTSDTFAQLLKVLKQKTEGQVGQRLDPLKVTIRQGVARYDTWGLPLGEFRVESEGTVDLVKRQIDVITWIPAGALTDQAMGLFKAGGVAGLLNKVAPPVAESLTKVPFRTKGSLDHPETRPDLELYTKNAVKQLRPDEIIKRNLGDLTNPKEPAPQPAPQPAPK